MKVHPFQSCTFRWVNLHPYTVGEMRRLLEGKGIAVVESYGSTPDHDFVYLSKAKLLVLSGGGFSKRAAQVNKQLNADDGLVIGTRDMGLPDNAHFVMNEVDDKPRDQVIMCACDSPACACRAKHHRGRG